MGVRNNDVYAIWSCLVFGNFYYQNLEGLRSFNPLKVFSIRVQLLPVNRQDLTLHSPTGNTNLCTITQ